MHVKNDAPTPAHVNDVDRLFNSAEARELLGGISRWRFYDLIRSGALAAVKQGDSAKSRTYVRASAIRAYIDSLPSAADPAT